VLGGGRGDGGGGGVSADIWSYSHLWLY